MVVAVTALVMSLSGGATRSSSPARASRTARSRNKDVRNRSLTGNDMRKDSVGGGAIDEATLGPVPSAFLAAGASRFAVVNAGGQAVRGRDVSSAARTSEGRYQVIFNGDVRNCAYYATVGDESARRRPAPRSASARSLERQRRGRAHRERHQRHRARPAVPPARHVLTRSG